MLLTGIMLTGLTACSGNNNNAGNTGNAATPEAGTNSGAAAKLDPVTLKMMLFGDKPVDLDKVLAEFETRTKDTLSTKLNIEFNSADDHKQKLKLKMSAGEEVDTVFDASWMNLYQNVSLGLYQPLDEYFNNDAYPGLKAAFSEDFLNSNKIDGHIYAIPFTQYYYDIEAILIRKDLRENYGLQPVQSYDDLEAYLKKVQENDPKMIPLALKGDRGFFKLFSNQDKIPTIRGGAIPGVGDNGVTGAGVNWIVGLSEDGKTVNNVVTYGDDEAEFAKLGSTAPYNTSDYYNQPFAKYVEFNKYVQKDVLSEKDNIGQFTSGKAAATESTIGAIPTQRQQLQEAIPGADVEIFVYFKAPQNLEKEAIATDYKAWNDLAVPITSKNIDRTMKFLDWMFSSQENHDLIELGIEGTHWNAEGDTQYKNGSKATDYRFPVYELTQNPSMSRINADNDAETLKYLEYSAKEDSYYRLPFSGFVFNSESVKTEIAKVQPKFEQQMQIIKGGLDPDWKDHLAKLNKELKGLGMDTIREEVKKQVQAYIDAGGI